MALDKIVNTLWGSSEIPENHIYEIIVSNLSYIALGCYLLLKKTNDVYDEDRYLRGMIMILVGFVSTIFHSSQVIHGHDDHRTSIFHFTDVATAVISFLIAIYLRGIDNVPEISWYLIVLSVPFYLYNGKYYWLAHSFWHVISAAVLFTILNY